MAKLYTGVDVHHAKKVDFNRLKNVEFMILKAGGSEKNDGTAKNGDFTDSKFEERYRECKARGIPVGAYYFAGLNFYGYSEGVACAEKMLKKLQFKTLELPIFIDVEAVAAGRHEDVTQACRGFCETIEKAGGFAGIYASDISGFVDRMHHADLKRYCHWVARYGKEPEVCREWQIWQKTSMGAVDGIEGNVDIDVTYINFPELMRRAHKNGY